MTDVTATFRTTHDQPETVASAVRPDNTAEMDTAVRDGVVETEIERPTTGGLRATATDYIANIDVAATVANHAANTDRFQS
jgi:hypothetical protein